MITITCTNCQSQLTMDEAFAGGVCRCQHCGTIQTVPKSARDGGDASSGIVAQAGGSAKTLWRQKSASEGNPGTGLEDLADIVASSGLAGSGLQSKRLRKAAPPPDATPDKKKKMKLYGAIGGGVLALLIVVLFLALRGGSAPPEVNTNIPQSGNVATGNTAAAIPIINGPSFGGVKLDSANTVVFLLDRGSGTMNVFGDLKAMTLKSVQSLTSDRKFQIVFWQVRGDVITYPESGTTVAGDISISEAVRKLEDVSAFGSSSVGPALLKASSVKPDTVILCTGKGDDLDESFVKEVLDNRPSGAKIYTFAVGSSHPIPQLQSIASKTGGEYRTISEAQLTQFAK